VRERWNQKYREKPEVWLVPDPFLLAAYEEFVLPRFPNCGTALDLAGGAGRHSIWLAKQGWDATVMDISDVSVEQAWQNAGPLAHRLHCVVDDLTRFQAAQMQVDLVLGFFFLERAIFPEIVKAIKPGGLLVYKTHVALLEEGGSERKRSAYWLESGELLELSRPLQTLHYRENPGKKPTAELVALKET
jgi:SAM-dependent methyltransferase